MTPTTTPLSAHNLMLVRDELLAQARAKHAPYPQYDGHFDHYVVAQVVKPRRSRGQQIMSKGQFVLLDPTSFHRRDQMPGYMPNIDKGDPATVFVTVYLHTNLSGCDTIVRADDVKIVQS